MWILRIDMAKIAREGSEVVGDIGEAQRIATDQFGRRHGAERAVIG